MELVTVRKEDVPEYLRESAFFLALDDEGNEEFSIEITHFKRDTVITDANSFRNLLYTLRFWGVDSIPTSVYDSAFDEDCKYFVSVASEFEKELRYLEELIQLRSLPLENRLEHACKNGNLQMVRSLISGKSVSISGNCLEAAASGGHLHCIHFFHSLRGRRHWNRICDAAAAKGHLSCVEYVYKHTNAFFNGAHGAAAHGHTNILRFIAHHGGTLDKELYETCLPRLEVVKCLHELNVSHWPHGYAHNLVVWDVAPVLRFALARGCPMHDLILREARSDECVKILVEAGCVLSVQATLRAVKQNKLELLTYLHERHCPWEAYCLSDAIGHGSYECLVYMYEQGCPVLAYYKDYFLDPSNPKFSSEKWDSKCINYLRNHFDFKRKCFVGRHLEGNEFVVSPENTGLLNNFEEVSEEELPQRSRACVIQ
eukprot:gene16209-18501_t